MITEGYLVRHYQGRKGGRGPAIIDIAQDHLLAHLSEAGIFELRCSRAEEWEARKMIEASDRNEEA